MSRVSGLRSRSTQIFSIFGQCEAAAAEYMIEKHGCYKIEFKDIPASAAFNEQGQPAKFAVMVPPDKASLFHRTCADLRS